MTQRKHSMNEVEHRSKRVAKIITRHENSVLILVMVALIGIFAVATKGLSTTRANVLNILLQSSIRGVSSVGQAFVILSAGIDLSVGGIGLFSAIIGTLMMTGAEDLNIVGHPVSIFVAIPVMLLIAAGFGAINGVAVSRIGMPPLIVTLAFWQITQGLAYRASGGRSITQLPEVLAFFGQGDVSGVPVPVIIFVIVGVLAYLVLNHTSYGRSVYAVGGNPLSAWLSGINVRGMLFSVYVISGFLAGLSGVIMTGRVMSSAMRTLEGLELDTIASVSVGGVSLSGGKGSIIGVIIGVLIIGIVNNAMSVLGAGPAVQLVVKGAIIFGAVAADFVRRRD